MMAVTNDNHNSNLTDTEWYFLGEYPLKVLGVDGEIQDRSEDGILIETIRDLGIGAELIDNIERKLIGFAGGAMAQLDQECFERPATIRLFCQKKMVEDRKSMKSLSQLKEKLTIKYSHNIHQSDPAFNGGWGYFLVKRGGGPNPAYSVNTNIRIDLFIYKE